MTRTPLILALLTSFCVAAPLDLSIPQRDINNNLQSRLVTKPTGSNNGLLMYNGATLLPDLVEFDSTMAYNPATDRLGLSASWLTDLDSNFADMYAYADNLAMTPGPQGIQGIQGIQGPIGLTGPQGATGITGATGLQGPIGLTGPQGLIGMTGEAGPTGIQGIQGIQGLTGATGAQGPIGLTGPSGSNASVTGTAPINVSGGVISLSGVGTPGTYSGVTTDIFGRVTSGTQMTITNNPSRSIQTNASAANGILLDASRNTDVRYTISTSTTATIGGASSATVLLEICPTNSSTASDWTTIGSVSNGQTVTLAIALQSTQTMNSEIVRVVPAGFFSRLRSIISGTGTVVLASIQEIKL